MKLNLVRLRLLLVLVGLLTPTVVMALGHTYFIGCDGCHTPHNVEALPGVPLWNGSETTTTFVRYSSDTFQGAADGQPSGDSRLCLSCHDGSNSNYAWMNPDHSFGTDELTSSHPISFVYDSALAAQDGALKDPSEASTLRRARYSAAVVMMFIHPASAIACYGATITVASTGPNCAACAT
jgi:hypothetical protein